MHGAAAASESLSPATCGDTPNARSTAGKAPAGRRCVRVQKQAAPGHGPRRPRHSSAGHVRAGRLRRARTNPSRKHPCRDCDGCPPRVLLMAVCSAPSACPLPARRQPPPVPLLGSSQASARTCPTSSAMRCASCSTGTTTDSRTARSRQSRQSGQPGHCERCGSDSPPVGRRSAPADGLGAGLHDVGSGHGADDTFRPRLTNPVRLRTADNRCRPPTPPSALPCSA